MLAWAQSKNIASQCVTAATSLLKTLALVATLHSGLLMLLWNSHLCHELFPVWLLNIGAQARAPGFWDGSIKTWCLHLSFHQFNTFFYYWISHSQTISQYNITSHFSTPKKECEGTFANIFVFNSVLLGSSFLETGHLLVRSALIVWTAERQWEDSWSAGLPMPCCFPLQGLRDAFTQWWWLCHGYWLFGKQICLFI